MKWYEPVLEKLNIGQIYSRQELINLLKADYPYVSANSYNWAVNGLLKSGELMKIGYNQYSLRNNEKPQYVPKYSDQARNIISAVEKKYSDIDFVVLETNLLNEFLKTPIEPNLIILQTNKELGGIVFRFLQEQGFAGLLYRPTKKLFDFYRTRNTIMIGNLVSESPSYFVKPQNQEKSGRFDISYLVKQSQLVLNSPRISCGIVSRRYSKPSIQLSWI